MKKGLESLKNAVQKDCKEGENCFNESGCTKERHKYVPQDNPALLEMGIKTSCISTTKCFHSYCDKYKWILERANHYADVCGSTVEKVVEAWEEGRSYWYMNYYQECNQVEIKGKDVLLYDAWIEELHKRFGKDPKNWKFKCPSCGHVQSIKDFIDHGIESPEAKVYRNCIGRYVKGNGCDWTLGGLLSINRVTVVKDLQAFPVFEMADKDSKVSKEVKDLKKAERVKTKI